MTTSAQTRRERNRLGVLVALSLAAFIISLNVTIVNVAVPTLVRTLGGPTTQLQWVFDAYSLVFAAFVIGLLVAWAVPKGRVEAESAPLSIPLVPAQGEAR